MSFAVAHLSAHHLFLEIQFLKRSKSSTCIARGHSIDSTHTEPYADRLSHGLRTFDEFVTTALQHNQNGKGGFAVSFYVRLQMKRNICDSQSANWSQGLQVAV